MRTGNQLGLFDLTSNSSGTSANVVPPPTTSNSAAAVEVGRLKDELIQNRARLTSFEENIQQARTACEVYKREATLANRKADLAYKEKDAAMLKLAQMQKELDSLSGGPHLHVIRRVQDLKSTPIGVLKTIEWQLRKDLQEVEKVRFFFFCYLQFSKNLLVSFGAARCYYYLRRNANHERTRMYYM